MFQDSNKEYTGSGAGVAGGKPATPVSLSIAQEEAVQAAVGAALAQLQRQQTLEDVQTARSQLYEVVREMIQSPQQSIEPQVVVDRWQQQAHAPRSIHPSVEQEAAHSAFNGQVGSHVSVPRHPQADAQNGTAPQKVPVSDPASEVSQEAGVGVQDAEALTKEAAADAQTSDAVGDTVGQSEPESSMQTAHLDELPTQSPERAAGESQQFAPASQADTVNPLVDSRTQSAEEAPVSNPAPAGQEVTATPTALNEPAVAAEKSASTETPVPNQAEGSPAKTQESTGSSEAVAPAQTIPPTITDQQSGKGAPPAAKPAAPSLANNGEAGQPQAQSSAQQLQSGGLPTGVRDRFKRGLEDRKSGQGFKEAYSARKLPPGGSAVKGAGEGAAKGAAKGLAKEGAKDVAATAAKTAAKEGVKDTAKLASKTTPVGLLTNIDAKGAYKAAKDLKNFKVVSAVKGATQSAAVTLFRASYDPWVIGFTVGLSLIVTLIVGSVIFIMPSSSMTFLERLLVVALWILLLFIVLLVFGLLLVGMCNGPTGWGVWAASWVSKAAADINKFCEPIGILQALTKQ